MAYLSSSTLISDSANSVHVMKMCAALTRAGHEVTLYGYQGSGQNHQDILDYYNIQSSYKIVRIHKKEEAGEILYYLKYFPFIRLGGLPALQFGLLKLKDIIVKNGKPDLLFSRNMYWLYGVRSLAPYFYESHCPPQNFVQKLIENRLLSHSNCKALVLISEKLAEIYRNIFPQFAHKIIVAHDGADDPDTTLELSTARPFQNIGYVGHLYQGRGIEIIFGCARACPNLTFHIVGGQQNLIEHYKKNDVPENIIFHGHLPQGDLQKHYKNFDAVLAPYQQKVSVHGNKGDTSAFMSPLKIFEYMSWGLPILSSDMPVLREVLHHNENAIMLEPANESQWVAALKKLEHDKIFREKLARNSRSAFLQNYTWDKRVEIIFNKANF